MMNFSVETTEYRQPADKLLALIIDNPFATDGEIEDIALHSQRPVDKKIQVSVRLNGG